MHVGGGGGGAITGASGMGDGGAGRAESCRLPVGTHQTSSQVNQFLQQLLFLIPSPSS